MDKMTVCGQDYSILRLLGRGKGGYSYLAQRGNSLVVCKQIHHEKCDYYSFGDKLEAERRDYQRLLDAGIRIPEMLAVDTATERIVKEYIEGPTVFDLVRDGVPVDAYLRQVREMAASAQAKNLNIDYFPTNFVVKDGLIWYIDYECNAYMDAWSFENWGIRYWSRTPEFEVYLKERPIVLLNGPSSSGKSTLARALQAYEKEKNGKTFSIVSIDDFMKIGEDETIYEDDVFEISGEMCEAVLEALKSASGVIIDHVITSERIYRQAMDRLGAYPILCVHVACPLEELLRREKARGNRVRGTAESSYEYLYPKDGYDLTVDTFAQTTAQICEILYNALKEGN